MTPAALAAIEAKRKAARKSHYISGEGQWHTEEINSADLDALLAHIRTMEAEREAEIAAAVARERERAATLAEPSGPRPCDCEAGACYCQNTGDAASVGWWDAQTAIAAAIREPKP